MKRGGQSLHAFIMREAAVCGRMKPKPKAGNTEPQNKAPKPPVAEELAPPTVGQTPSSDRGQG